MDSPYLIIDRSGNAVDINSTEPTACHGCPDRMVEPRCHMTLLVRGTSEIIDESERISLNILEVEG